MPKASWRGAIEAFYFGYREFTTGPDKLLARRGLGRAHHRILYFVGRKPGIGMGELLDTLQISKQALNAPLRQLIAMDLIQREAEPPDRRTKRLRLTKTGQQLETQLTGVQTELLSAAFEAAGPASREVWLAVMAALVAPDPVTNTPS